MPTFGKRGLDFPQQMVRQAPAPDPSRKDNLDLEEEPATPERVMIATGVGAVLLMAVTAAVYLAINYFPSGLLNTADAGYVSPLDASCGKGWEDGMPNGKQIKCYLTTSTERLCNGQERDHLVAVLKRYEKDAAVYFRRSTVAAIGSIVNAQTDGPKLGLAASRLKEEMSKDPLSPETQEVSREVETLANGIMYEHDKVLKSAKNMEPEYRLINDVKALMIEGYISKDDFGWYGVSIVNKAHREIVDGNITVRRACG